MDAHREAAQAVAAYASRVSGVDTILVVNSCARGKAVPESDLDMALLVLEDFDEAELEGDWLEHLAANELLQSFRARGPHSQIHLDFFDGRFSPAWWDDGGGPDDFEIEIGNRVAHAEPLIESGPGFNALRKQWLPYYDEPLRLARIQMVADACQYDLECVPFYAGRGLYLQAFDRLYKAFRQFLQALFIANRTYPVAYNKWLEEQLAWINQSAIYLPLLEILSVSGLTGPRLMDSAARLTALTEDLSSRRGS